MSTIIYYLSATGNSLYVARFLRDSLPDVELRSVPEELFHGRLSAEADCVGFVFPLHYLGLPLQMEPFLERLDIYGAPYLFAVATCGVPYIGKPFADADEILAAKGHRLNASWFVRLVSNYLPLRDTAAEWRISIRAWLAERKLRKIAGAIRNREPHQTWQLMRGTCRKYHDEWKSRRQNIDENFHCDLSKCVACGLCEKVCPTGNILRPDGSPVWQHRCVECLGCLHICPKEAIDYGESTKGRRRYRHKEMSPTDLLHDFHTK